MEAVTNIKSSKIVVVFFHYSMFDMSLFVQVPY